MTSAFRPGGEAPVYAANDTLDGADVLPGYSLPVAAIFEA
jgi:hypothetical protein